MLAGFLVGLVLGFFVGVVVMTVYALRLATRQRRPQVDGDQD